MKIWLILFALPLAAATDGPTILSTRCGQCHGESTAMSGLKVTSADNLLKGGHRGPALIPGKSNESLLYKAVAHIGNVVMPPGGTLSPDEVAAIKTWIDGGA